MKFNLLAVAFIFWGRQLVCQLAQACPFLTSCHSQRKNDILIANGRDCHVKIS